MITLPELTRQYRLAKQTMAMHYALHDTYKRKALIAESILLVASTLFCVTTFASDDLFGLFGLDPNYSRVLLGVASVLAFVASLLSMLIDWRGAAARHKDGAERWSRVVKAFREHESDDRTWDPDSFGLLTTAYWDAAHNAAPIPDGKFGALKSKYLTKVAMSKLASEHPGAPRILIWAMVKYRGGIGVIKENNGADFNE